MSCRFVVQVRGDRLLFRTEAIKAVVGKERCFLIKNRRDRDFHDIIKPLSLVGVCCLWWCSLP